MNDIQERTIRQFCRSLRSDHEIRASFYGWTVRLEERHGSHLGRSILVHLSNNTERLASLLKDIQCVVLEEGAPFRPEGIEAYHALGLRTPYEQMALECIA